MGLVRFGQQKAIYERFSLKALRTSSNVLDPIPELKIQAEKAAEAMLTIALFLKFFLLFSLMKWIKRYEKFVIVRDNFKHTKILTLDTCQPSLIQHDSVQLAQNFRKDGKTKIQMFSVFKHKLSTIGQTFCASSRIQRSWIIVWFFYFVQPS